jgi:hypothetical protein
MMRSREDGWCLELGNLLIEPIYGAVWEELGEEVQYQGFTVPRWCVARQFAIDFCRWLGRAVGSVVKPISVRLMPGGL